MGAFLLADFTNKLVVNAANKWDIFTFDKYRKVTWSLWIPQTQKDENLC